MRRAALWGMAAVAAFIASAEAQAEVPDRFHGVTLQEELTADEVARMRRGEVGAVRFMISWAAVEQRAGEYDWSTVDRTLEAIRSTGARPMPLVFASPAWLRRNPSRPPVGTPRGEEAWSRFLAALVDRYGPGGQMAAARPVRDWQLWNEPNLPAYWGSFPSPPDYVRLLELGSAAIHAQDPRARVVLAGLSPAGRGIKPWDFLERVYATGGGDAFDVVALHPYGATLAEAAEQVRSARRVMRANGDGHKPMTITEIGWGSDGSRFHPLSGTERSQARMVTRTFDLFAANRRRWHIDSVYWYSWRDLATEAEYCSFCMITGLLSADGEPKPAWGAFKRSERALRAGPKARNFGRAAGF